MIIKSLKVLFILLAAFAFTAPTNAEVFLQIGGGVKDIHGGPITFTIFCGKANELCVAVGVDNDGPYVDVNCIGPTPPCGLWHYSGSYQIGTDSEGDTTMTASFTEI
jgi:hypothetical protein